MLRRLLRSLPRSSPSQIVGQRLSLRPSIFIYLGVSAATITTFLTIHADATQPFVDKSKKKTDLLAPENQADNSIVDKTLEDCSESMVLTDVGVRRLDSIVLPSNSPCEDFVSGHSFAFSDTLHYSMFAVLDGHNGEVLSAILKQVLYSKVHDELLDLYSVHAKALKPMHTDVQDLYTGEKQGGLIEGLYKGMPNPNPSEEEIDQCIKEAFMWVDDWAVENLAREALAETSKEEAVKQLTLADAGSCALMGIYNNVKRTFKVALTGDSRAVLGRRVALEKDTYAYETHVLSADQNGYNPQEVERLEAAHPGEEIFTNGRMLGWGMTRAFGNSSYKLSRKVQQRIYEKFLGDPPQRNCLTPPYFTAEPVITTTTIKKGDFVVLASDGLWDCLTNEEAVGLVGAWLETRGKEVRIEKDEGIGEGEMVMLPVGKTVAAGKHPMNGFGKGKGVGWNEGKEDEAAPIWERTDLPVTSLEADETRMYKKWRATKRFINVDDNAAVHLARSALGGADRDLTGALLQMMPPRSRRFSDDISVLVVFFD